MTLYVYSIEIYEHRKGTRGDKLADIHSVGELHAIFDDAIFSQHDLARAILAARNQELRRYVSILTHDFQLSPHGRRQAMFKIDEKGEWETWLNVHIVPELDDIIDLVDHRS